MADGGYGPDFLTKSMFFREAEQGPSQQELATMTAPFQGNPQQALAFMQSPGMQQQLQHFGMHFDPSQVRQSPFLPNQFMQQHPMLGGGISQALANVASTPEAPLVSGAGSGMSRAAQGMYGGNDLMRQFQVRQMMAPMQAMGMQLPMMAEQRRQSLLQALMEDMQQRRAAEEQHLQQKTGADKIRDDIYAPPLAPGYFQMQKPQQSQLMMPGAGLTGQGGPGPTMQGPMTPGGPQFHPYDLTQVHQLTQARQTDEQAAQRAGAGALSTSKAKEQTAETAGGMPGAKVEATRAQGAERRAGAQQKLASAGEKLARIKGESPTAYAKFSQQYNAAEAQHQKLTQHIQELVAAKSITPQAAKTMQKMADDDLATAKANIDQARGRPGESAGYGGPAMNPGAALPPPQAPQGSGQARRPGGTVGSTSATTATTPSSWDQIKQQRQAQQQPQQ